jgi:hypothetical protein
LLRETEAAGGVLTVGENEIDVVLFTQQGQMFGEGFAPGGTDDVGDREDGEVRL